MRVKSGVQTKMKCYMSFIEDRPLIGEPSVQARKHDRSRNASASNSGLPAPVDTI